MAFIRSYLDGSEDTDGSIFGVGGFVGDGDDLLIACIRRSRFCTGMIMDDIPER
jgi:hypothetical protein